MPLINLELKRRIVSISHAHHLSHIGSCLGAVDVIDGIYSRRQDGDRFVLSCGHAGLALYVVLEKHFGHDAEALLKKHGIHPCRCAEDHIDCSTGSLGQGITVAVGMALAARGRLVYCLISDGECAEGAVWEALRVSRDEDLTNLKILCLINGYGAYSKIDGKVLIDRIHSFNPAVEIDIVDLSPYAPILSGLDAHYKVLNDADYAALMERIS